MGEDGRFRLQHQFWLNANNQGDHELAELIETLKSTKKYTDTLRRGIRIDFDLQQGRLDTLFATYPWVKELFQFSQGRATQPASPYMGPFTSEDEQEATITITSVSTNDAADNLLDSLDNLEF